MDQSVKKKAIYNHKLEIALKAREEFLKEHPELRPVQDDIDRVLQNTEGCGNRLKAIAFLLDKKLCQLNAAVIYFQSIIEMPPDEAKVVDPDAIPSSRRHSMRHLN